MCYVGQVSKLCLFIVVLAVVGAVIFGFVWLSHEHHHHNNDHKCENGCSPPSSGNGNFVPSGNGNFAPPGNGNFVPLAVVPPPVSSTRPFIAANSPTISQSCIFILIRYSFVFLKLYLIGVRSLALYATQLFQYLLVRAIATLMYTFLSCNIVDLS